MLCYVSHGLEPVSTCLLLQPVCSMRLLGSEEAVQRWWRVFHGWGEIRVNKRHLTGQVIAVNMRQVVLIFKANFSHHSVLRII